MAHWAEINENNIVLRVLVTSNDDPNGDEGHHWLIDAFGGRWIQTSYNGNIRNKFAGIGDTYLEEQDVFIAPQPYPSWTLDESFIWQPPIPYPNDEQLYTWNEETISWDLEAN